MIFATLEAARDPERPTDRIIARKPAPDRVLAAIADAKGDDELAALTARRAADHAIAALAVLDPKRYRKHKSWEKLLRELDAVIAADDKMGETGLLLVAADAGHVYVAGVGEGAAWILGRGFDQDLSAELPKSPLLGSGEARPAFAQATLPGPAGEDHARGGAAILAMTPGVWKHVEKAHLAEAALHRAPEGACARIEEVARWRNNGALADDVAAIVIRRR